MDLPGPPVPTDTGPVPLVRVARLRGPGCAAVRCAARYESLPTGSLAPYCFRARHGEREARGRAGNAPRHLRPRRPGGRLSRGAVLLGRAARPALRGREGPSAPYLRRDVTDRTWRPRPLHAHSRLGVQALAR